MTHPTELRDHLCEAVEALLKAQACLGLPRLHETPTDALDAALTDDPAYQDARQQFREALESGSVLEVEQAHNHAIATAVEVGWLLATGTVGTTPPEEAP